MGIELKVTWDGDVQGLREHRLSVSAFADPLEKLLRAIKRRASNIVRDATGQGETSRGRLADEAARIDIEIEGLVKGSLGFESQITLQPPPDGQMSLWMTLPQDATDRVLEDLEKEGHGVPRDAHVRDYLVSLPPGITYQRYRMFVDGDLRRDVELGAPTIAQLIGDLPYLVEQVGPIIALGFDPGRRFVRIKDRESGSEVTLESRDKTVDRAFELLAEGDVRVLYLDSGSSGPRRLLHIQGANERRHRLDVERYVFDKWSHVLEVLAQ